MCRHRLRRILLGIIFAGSASAQIPAYTYCENWRWNSQTRFDGPIGVAGDKGVVTYLGHNPLPSDNVGVYQFTSDTIFFMDFAGEPRHTCVKQTSFEWDCKMGRYFKYHLSCDW